MGVARHKANGTTEGKWSLIGSAVNLNFADKPQKREGSRIFYFPYTFTDPITKKYRHSRISTGEKDGTRALKMRDQLKELVLTTLSSTEIQHSDKQSVRQFFQTFLLAKENEGLSVKTLYDYRLRLDHFAKHLSFDLPLCEVSANILRSYFGKIDSKTTANLSMRILRSVFNWAITEGKLKANPFNTVKLKKPLQNKREYLTETEFRKVFSAMPEGTYGERAAKAAALLGFATGMRLGEISHLKVTSIRWDRNDLIIRNSEFFQTKNGSERTFPLTERVKEALNLQLKNRISHPKEEVRESIYLFTNEAGKPYTNAKDKRSKLSGIFSEVCRIVFPDRKKLHFHSLRHSFGQNSYNAGIPIVEISKLMGHKSVAITMQYYAKSSDYENCSQIYEYLKDQSPITKQAPITGKLSVEELECVHSVTII
jgi:integrase/recombinase XerC